ncbi:hypothetical protein Slin15195_G016760 [Septoria linicola]|uniref:Uncharacterized protein n=1 Tax=Septoria linicola TaxID=215465 RepID=A0A9Q9ALS8_9PEZI|nr:hypothetical protein Slin14017_G016820 [Septoria linicola]USW48357.1 hypothetical protein Slin15195_G016760 [Septoria linicola]
MEDIASVYSDLTESIEDFSDCSTNECEHEDQGGGEAKPAAFIDLLQQCGAYNGQPDPTFT